MQLNLTKKVIIVSGGACVRDEGRTNGRALFRGDGLLPFGESNPFKRVRG